MVSKKILSTLVASTLVVPLFSTNLAYAEASEPVPGAPNLLTKNSNEELAKEILENGIISDIVVIENNNSEVPPGFTPISEFSFDLGSSIQYGVDPGGGTTYWDGFYSINQQIPTWVLAAGVAYVGTWIAERYRIPSRITAALLAGAGSLISQDVVIKGTTYYKLISATKAEYYTMTSLYINGKLKSSTDGSWTAAIDTNID